MKILKEKARRERKGFRTGLNNEDTYELHGFIHEAEESYAILAISCAGQQA